MASLHLIQNGCGSKNPSMFFFFFFGGGGGGGGGIYFIKVVQLKLIGYCVGI